MSGFIHVRIDSMEYQNAQGITELEVSAVEEPLAAIVRMPVIDQPRYTEQITRLRAEGRSFPVSADFFEMSEEAKCRELLRAVSALFPEIPPPLAPPTREPVPNRAVTGEPEQRLTRIIHRTNGAFLVLMTRSDEYGMLDDIELNKLREFLDEDPASARPSIGSLLSDEIWDRDLMDPPPVISLELRENRWALEREDGELFAHLDDRDIAALRRARGW